MKYVKINHLINKIYVLQEKSAVIGNPSNTQGTLKKIYCEYIPFLMMYLKILRMENFEYKLKVIRKTNEVLRNCVITLILLYIIYMK